MEQQTDADGPALASRKTLEIIVAILFLGIAAIFLYDSLRLGFHWVEGQGPGAGYFPFYLSLMLIGASLVNLSRAALSRDPRQQEAFTTRPAAMRVMTVLLPSIAYVGLIGGVSIGSIEVPGLGIYVASALFTFFFMVAFGSEPTHRATAIALSVPLFFFFIFEKWFLVPLPKGPLEAMLGYA